MYGIDFLPPLCYTALKPNKMKKFAKSPKRAFLIEKINKKAAAVGLFLLINIFNLAVAAAPNEPMESTPEAINQLTSLAALSALENGYKTMKVVLTAYSSTPDQTDETPFITAANTEIRDGVIASNFLPFGTKVRIPELFGDKIFTVEDRMHERFSNRIDIWFQDRETAEEFGLRKATIQIL